jgi:hypothetical protein
VCFSDCGDSSSFLHWEVCVLVALYRSQFARKPAVDFFYLALCSEGLMFVYRFWVLRFFVFCIQSLYAYVGAAR